MTEDDITRGLNQTNLLTGKPFAAGRSPSNIESVIATLPDRRRRDAGAVEAQPLLRTSRRMERRPRASRRTRSPPPAAEPVFEMHNLTADPEERHNRAGDAAHELGQLQSVLAAQRDEKRLVPSLRNH